MFDPYRKWLGIPPKDQPPNHYRLLSLELFEPDLDVIEGAADRQMGFVRQYQSGEHAALAAKLLNEIAVARLCLLKPASKTEYDAKLKSKSAVRKRSTVPETADDEEAPFEIDAETAAMMMMAPKLVQKRKRKKSKSPQGLWIAGGAGTVACVVIFGAMFSSNGHLRPVPSEPPQELVAQPKTTVTPIATVAPAPTVAPTAPMTAPIKTPAAPGVEVAVPKTLPTPKVVALVDSQFIADPVGPPIDLMEDLRSQSKSYYTSLLAPVPADYQLKFNVTRLDATAALWVGFVMDGRQGVAVFDGWKAKLTALYMDGREATGNCTTHPGPVLENGRSSTIALTVHPGHVHVSVDSQTVIDWYGTPERLYFPADNFPPNRELPFVAKKADAFEFASAELIPIKPEPKTSRDSRFDSPVDLMPLFNIARDARKGDWTTNDNVLASSETLAQIQTPVVVPEEYTLSFTIERSQGAKGDPQLTVGLLAGSSICQVVACAKDGLGLDMINGKRWDKNETYIAGNPLLPGETAKVAFTVTKQGIRYDFNGRTLIDWRGDSELLNLPPEDYLADARKLFLSSRSAYRFHDLKIEPPREPPKLPAHPPLAAGNPVQLVPLVDVKRDVFEGSWKHEFGGMRLMGQNKISKLVLPVEVPAEYKLTVLAGREINGVVANGPLLIALPTESSTAEVWIDADSMKVSGVHLDGLLPTDRTNPTSQKISVIPVAKTPVLMFFVRKTGLKVMKGETEIINWSGNPNRFTRSSEFDVPDGRIAIGSKGNQFWFNNLVLEPLEPTSFPAPSESGTEGNLLSLIDPQRDSRGGEWKFNGTSLVSTNIRLSRLRIPVSVPKQYVLTANVERKTGVSEFLVGMVIDGKPCAAAIDGEKGTTAGVMCLDGLASDAKANPTRRVYTKPLLPIGKRVSLQCIVLADTVIVNCGDKEVIRWHGDAKRFSLPEPEYLPPNYSSADRDHLWLGSLLSAFAIHELELKTLSDDQASEIANSFSGVFPTTLQANLPLSEVSSKVP